ncbi:hypothetical protein K438DRAFT_1955295 [Mycena galopus ATCC 62051]|nr:hypothetical protein K438DRAFT_1955295 [Mycena galopus ATCC 62051]
MHTVLQILDNVPVIDVHIDLPILLCSVFANNVSAVDLSKEFVGYVDIPHLRVGKGSGFFCLSPPNLDPSSLAAIDIPMADPLSSADTDEDTFICLGNVEGALFRLTGLVENLSNTAPHTALVRGVPPPIGSPELFTDVHLVTKSVLKLNPCSSSTAIDPSAHRSSTLSV